MSRCNSCCLAMCIGALACGERVRCKFFASDAPGLRAWRSLAARSGHHDRMRRIWRRLAQQGSRDTSGHVACFAIAQQSRTGEIPDHVAYQRSRSVFLGPHCGLDRQLSKEGCGRATPSSEAQTEQAAPAAAEESDLAQAAVTAKTTFNGKCVVCHGSVGTGDGPGAAALTPKPRAFADAAWQGSVADEQIAKAIIEGGAAVGKSPNMPPNPELADKPEVVKALVSIVRGFKKG